MTPMTTCFIIIGIIALMQAADDWGLWVWLEHRYSKKASHGRTSGCQREIIQN
ncbi:MAG: hypothetical protein IKL28_08680 [Lachnospiraceae bacterium]|nr:hypothetical protein [Lachnospiraceae bacterium]